jgi:hemerythrin superfamily protein
MAARKSGASGKGGGKPARSEDDVAEDAIEMLIEDHRRVEELFEEFESSKDDDDDDEKAARVGAICLELTIHATLEEEIFYPAARAALAEDGEDLLDEAEVEHESVRMLIAELSDAQPGDDLYDARVKVLSEYVKHHVAEEEGELFPKLRDAEFDSDALGQEMLERKESLRDELEEESTA